MGAIYSNTSCNIAATFAKDSDQGCFNTRDPSIISPTTIVSNLGFGQATRYKVSIENFYHDHYVNGPLNTRGWVVQERCLAPRQLSFGEHDVFWVCAHLSACEQFPDGLPDCEWQGDLVAPPAAKPRLTFTNEHQLRQMWCSLVEHYTICDLSQPSDKTIALAGLAKEYQKITGDIYLAGLWNTDFHKQLCWRWNHIWDQKEPACFRTPQYQGPTWSWMSIDGPAGMDHSYYSQEQQHTCFLSLLDVWTESIDPANFHSFISCEVRIQAVAVWILFLPAGDEGDAEEDCHMKIRAGEQVWEIKSLFDDRYLTWDEDIPFVMKSAHPMQWDRLQEARNSDILFVLASGHFKRKVLQGILLKEEYTAEGKPKFVRMGALSLEGPASRLLFDILTARLELASDAQLAGKIDLDDPRLSDLVHTINII